MNKPTISACMIVKNEEALLPACLNSIKNAVDEIIIVDTGSSDNTVAIAKSFGARVYHHLWNNSFSEARTHSLGYATGDWILQIDADEELEQADIPALRQAVADTRYNGVAVAIISTINDNLHTFYNTRVFRRGKAFYRDIIHEQIVVEGERLPTEIRLYHHGYNLAKEKMQRKWELTTSLLKKQISQDKYNGFAWFNLIRNFRTQDMFHDGVKAGEEALRLVAPGNNARHYAMIVYETANCLLHANAPAQARELCNAALSDLSERSHTPENIDIVFTLACAHLMEGSHRLAISCFERYLSLREWYFKNRHAIPLTVDTLGYEYAAYNGLGFCLGSLGERQKAVDCFQKAVNANPKYLPAYENLERMYSGMNNYPEAASTLLRAISEGINNDAVFLKLGSLYRKLKRYEKAITYLEEYMKRRPHDKNALLNIAWCYEELGCMEAADIGYAAAANVNPSDTNQFDISLETLLDANPRRWAVLHAWARAGKIIPPPPGKEKEQTIKEYAARFSTDILVETGTFVGSTTQAMKNTFKEIFSIELDHNLYELAKSIFAHDAHVHIIEGDSGEILPKLLGDVQSPCLFWLDGHYSGKGTAKGEQETPIQKELKTIFAHKIINHVILIDDAKDFTGDNGYPAIEELRSFVLQYRPGWIFEVKNGIIRIHKNP